MKPHIKRRGVYSPYHEPTHNKMCWCIYEPDTENDWFGYGDTLKDAWNDYLLEKMWWEVVVDDDTGEFDHLDSIEAMIEFCGYPEGWLE